MEVYLDRVNISQKETLYRLLEYSLFEESKNDGNEMDENGIYPYRYFDLYFTEKERDAFFIRNKENNQLLGFVMLNTYMQKNPQGHSVAEFMVLPKYRRHHIGKKVAFQCFDQYMGCWEVSPSLGSDSAYRFWENVIREYTDNNYTYHDRLFVFNSNK